MTVVETVGEITEKPPSVVLAGSSPKTIQHDNEKWLKYLLTNDQIELMRRLRGKPRYHQSVHFRKRGRGSRHWQEFLFCT